MWASFTRVRVDPSRADEAIDLVREELVPAFAGRDGAMQGYWMLDRATGTGLVVSCWADRDSLDAGRAQGGTSRAAVLERLDALLCETGTYEVHALAGTPAPIDGGHVWSRVTFLEGVDPVRLAGERGLFASMHAQSATQAGFLSLCWLVDAETHNGMSISTWRSRDELRASAPHGRGLRRKAAQVLGCRVEEVVEVETIGTAGCGPGDLVLDLRDSLAAEHRR